MIINQWIQRYHIRTVFSDKPIWTWTWGDCCYRGDWMQATPLYAPNLQLWSHKWENPITHGDLMIRKISKLTSVSRSQPTNPSMHGLMLQYRGFTKRNHYDCCGGFLTCWIQSSGINTDSRPTKNWDSDKTPKTAPLRAAYETCQLRSNSPTAKWPMAKWVVLSGKFIQIARFEIVWKLLGWLPLTNDCFTAAFQSLLSTMALLLDTPKSVSQA